MVNKKQTAKRLKKKSFSREVFKFLKEDFLQAIDLTTDFLINPTGGKYKYSLSKFFDNRNYFSRSPYFKKEKEGNYSVTPKGRIKIIKNVLKDKLDKKTEWSGFWWAIVFDVPEKKETPETCCVEN